MSMFNIAQSLWAPTSVLTTPPPQGPDEIHHQEALPNVPDQK